MSDQVFPNIGPDELVAASVRDTIWNPTPVQRCPRCRELKPVPDFEGFKNCLSCRIKIREQNRREYQRIKADPRRYARKLEQVAAGQRRRRERAQTDPDLRRRINEAARRYRARRKADPVRHARDLENRRIVESIKRREAGARAMPQRSPLRLAQHRDLIPIGPFRKWLKAHVEKIGSIQESAYLLGTNERTLRRVLVEGELVEMNVVDRCLINDDGFTLLSDLYPDLYPESDDDDMQAAA